MFVTPKKLNNMISTISQSWLLFDIIMDLQFLTHFQKGSRRHDDDYFDIIYSKIECINLLELIMISLSYFGHIKRHNTLEKLFLEGTCEGRRGRGRPRRRWTQDIGEWMGVLTVEAGRQALERGEFRQAVWEATSIKDPP